ncbi:MAG: aminotransferase class V-fold PLP-dependent enzyme [Gemmatimonadaceae bacterium]
MVGSDRGWSGPGCRGVAGCLSSGRSIELLDARQATCIVVTSLGIRRRPRSPFPALASRARHPHRHALRVAGWVRRAWVVGRAATFPPRIRPTSRREASGRPRRRSSNTVASIARLQNSGPTGVRQGAALEHIEPNLRARLARLFGAQPDEVALTHSTSESISIAVWGRDWRGDDEVIISNQEHPANIIPWYNLRDRRGIVIRTINLDAGTNLLDEVRPLLNVRTRMVSLPHVSRNNGRRIRTEDSAALARLLRAAGIRYLLDGAQGPGNVPVDFAALGCDYYCTCGHKWLMAPKGTGALFVRRDMRDATLMSWTGAHSHSTMDYEGHFTLLPSAARFEFGTRALADFAGFDRALSWLDEIGYARIHSRIQELADYAIGRARRSPRLQLSSPESTEDRSGIVTFRLPSGCSPLDVYKRLREGMDMHVSPVRDERDIRLAIHFFNTQREIDLALDAISAACG